MLLKEITRKPCVRFPTGTRSNQEKDCTRHHPPRRYAFWVPSRTGWFLSRWQLERRSRPKMDAPYANESWRPELRPFAACSRKNYTLRINAMRQVVVPQAEAFAALEHYVTEPAHSLISQSIHALESTASVNGDGFGLGWYSTHPEPGLYREVRPGWSDENLRYLCALTDSGNGRICTFRSRYANELEFLPLSRHREGIFGTLFRCT
jgi:hypothetical protein